jgi:hypothetical protein
MAPVRIVHLRFTLVGVPSPCNNPFPRSPSTFDSYLRVD